MQPYSSDKLGSELQKKAGGSVSRASYALYACPTQPTLTLTPTLPTDVSNLQPWVRYFNIIQARPTSLLAMDSRQPLSYKTHQSPNECLTLPSHWHTNPFHQGYLHSITPQISYLIQWLFKEGQPALSFYLPRAPDI